MGQHVQLLLRIQFYNQLLLDVLRNRVTLWMSHVSTLTFLLIPVHPVDLWILSADSTGDVIVCLALWLQLNNVSWLHAVRRNVHDLTVHHDVLVAYDLAGSRTGRSHTETVNGVVQTAFEELDQVFTGGTLQAGSFQVRVTELLLEHAVCVLSLLLFLQLNAILRCALALLRVTMLAWRKRVLVQVLARSEDRLAELTADSVLGAGITCHVAI